jgi:nucleoside-diphosphate-sugar epimerase
VLLSMLGAGADHPMELARMKYAAEQAVRSWSQPGRNAAEHRQDATQPGVADEQPARTWTIIRPAAYLETWLMVAGGPLLHGKPAVIFGRGRNPINFVAARDVARVVERAVRTPELHGLTLELTGPADLTLRDLAATMASAIGCPRAVRRVPLPVMRVASHLLRVVRPDVARLIRAGVIMDTTHMTAGAGPTPSARRAPITRASFSTPLSTRFPRAPLISFSPPR